MNLSSMDGEISPQEPSSGPIRSRATRACDKTEKQSDQLIWQNCKTKRSKCLPVPGSPKEDGASCILCSAAGLKCTYTVPAKRRGPPPGFKKPTNDTTDGVVSRPGSSVHSHFGSGSSGARKGKDDSGLCGLPPDLVDELLAVYFTHVHNVWPIIYKPLFNPHSTPPPLLLSICALASCVSPPPASTSHTPESLFRMAEESIRHAESDNGYTISIIQSFALLSLRQTGNGHKQSAFVYAGRACVGALSIGLNLKPSPMVPPVEVEIRSRTYWNVYVLEKILAEETGRPVLLPYKRSSIPFPSVNETDELESWPPLPMSSALVPRSVRHVVPRRGHVMSIFVWGIRLSILYEDILGMDVQTPLGVSGQDEDDGNGWDRDYELWKRDRLTDVEGLIRQLEAWKTSLPAYLDVNRNPEVSPLPQSVILVAWYETARILLYSRLSPSRYPTIPTYTPLGALIENSRSICSKAAQDVVDLFALADRHRLLTSISVDVIHMLSLTTLFEAFDSTCPDEAVAHRAKVNFAQCCIWLRDFSASWPTASAHKRFFEGLIQGGLRLTSWDDEAHIDHDLDSGTPGVQGGLRSFGQSLSTTRRDQREEMTDIFQLPQIYWNHLTNNDQIAGLPLTDSGPLDLGLNTVNESNSPPWTGVEGVLEENWWSHHNAHSQHNTMGPLFPSPSGDGGQVDVVESHPNFAQVNGQGEQDQSAIYAALMTYLVQAARGPGGS